jgi:hypothetical protein
VHDAVAVGIDHRQRHLHRIEQVLLLAPFALGLASRLLGVATADFETGLERKSEKSDQDRGQQRHRRPGAREQHDQPLALGDLERRHRVGRLGDTVVEERRLLFRTAPARQVADRRQQRGGDLALGSFRQTRGEGLPRAPARRSTIQADRRRDQGRLETGGEGLPVDVETEVGRQDRAHAPFLERHQESADHALSAEIEVGPGPA